MNNVGFTNVVHGVAHALYLFTPIMLFVIQEIKFWHGPHQVCNFFGDNQRGPVAQVCFIIGIVLPFILFEKSRSQAASRQRMDRIAPGILYRDLVRIEHLGRSHSCVGMRFHKANDRLQKMFWENGIVVEEE